eukprot:TRINITY_DN27263_c0_g1_i7.p1 TRINITY_DN27263_c0_g1~~TRINITY_DN27263_c0_g1_i7.p1  ORF type:complete len:180 (+),score=24.41 TRINITY_DN27263_c0_g1_i7:283-822(+)
MLRPPPPDRQKGGSMSQQCSVRRHLAQQDHCHDLTHAATVMAELRLSASWAQDLSLEGPSESAPPVPDRAIEQSHRQDMIDKMTLRTPSLSPAAWMYSGEFEADSSNADPSAHDIHVPDGSGEFEADSSNADTAAHDIHVPDGGSESDSQRLLHLDVPSCSEVELVYKMSCFGRGLMTF